MQTRIIGAVGETELEAQVNSFIDGKKVIDIKLTEWASFTNQTGGYTAYIMYDETAAPLRNVQIKIIPSKGDQELQTKVNQFIVGKNVVDIKFTEWVEYEQKEGGYTALVIYEATTVQQPMTQRQSTQQPQSSPQYNVL